jgi:CheY-like chemotaxis protein/HPt (histidine-containing phosphotransfer) domain-containing protein
VSIIARCHDANGAAPTISFEVADTGIGLSKEQRSLLFQPFAQADGSTTRRFGGTGLGLVICRRLAHLLGGEITLESLPGRGSSFTLTISAGSLAGVAMIEDLREAGVPAVPSSSSDPPHALVGSVLLAEDGLDNQLLIATHMRKVGLRVVIAENGRVAVEEALGAIRDGRPFDLIFMDMQMPELDGYGATSKLRSKDYRGPIVALTAHAMAGDRERCLQAGCDDYMTKPIDRVALINIAAKYLTPASSVRQTDRLVALHPGPQAVPPGPEPKARLVSEYAVDPDMAPLVERFVAGLAEKRCALQRAALETDLEPLRRLAHQLKGAGGGYGFPTITEAAAEVELAVAHGEPMVELRRKLGQLLELVEAAMPPGSTSVPVASQSIQRSVI